MTPAALPPFDKLKEQVEGLVANDEPLASIERMLDEAQLPAEQEAALWLLGWSMWARRTRSSGGRSSTARRRTRLALVPAPGRA